MTTSNVTDDCVFCNIVNKTIESQFLYEDSEVFAIKDILPKAPVHILIIPKEHLLSINHLESAHQALVGKMVIVAKDLAVKFGVSDSGYRLVFNVGRDGGQIIPHLHLHLLGGKKMAE